MKEVEHVSLVFKRLASPVGELRLVANEAALVAIHFPSRHNHTRGTPDPEASEVGRHAVLDLAAVELREYFEGRRKVFRTPLQAEGTEFQLAVWQRCATFRSAPPVRIRTSLERSVAPRPSAPSGSPMAATHTPSSFPVIA